MPSTGVADQDQEEGEGEGTPQDGTDRTESGVLETGGPMGTGEPEGDEASEGDEAGEGGLPESSPIPGTSDDEASGGWEISNQLPEPGGLATQDEQSGIGELPGEFDQELGDNRGLDPEDEELRRVLGVLDGEIMEERSDDLARANDRAAAAGGPADMQAEETTSESQGESSDSGVGEENSAVSEATNKGDGTPNLPPTMHTVADTPDARDKEVYARQLREAAMAEEDPELKEKLWEDYETYIEGLK